MIVGTLLTAVAFILSMLLNLYMWVVIIAVLISWVGADPFNPIVQLLRRLTNPVLSRIRALIPTSINGVDFSPLILAVVLKFIDLTLVQILANYGRSLSF